jgi:hypothetical protein
MEIYNSLTAAQMVSFRILNLDYYLSPIAWMGSGWINFAKVIILSCVLYTVVFFSINGRELYLRFKTAVKWW